MENSEQESLQKFLEPKSGMVLERAQSRLQMPALYLPQNLTLAMADQLKPQNQTPLGALQASESASQVDMTNPIEWVNSAHQKIMQIKEMYLSQFLMLHHKLQELKRQANDAEMENKWEKTRRFIEGIIRLLNISKPDLLRMKREIICQMMNDAVRYVSQLKPRNSLYSKQTHQVEASDNHLEAPQAQQRENHLHFNSLQQPLLRPGVAPCLPQSSLNSFNVGSSAGVHKVDASSTMNSYQYNMMRPTQPLSRSPMAQAPLSMPHLHNSQQDQAMKRQKMKQPVQQFMNEKNKQQMLHKRTENMKLVGNNQNSLNSSPQFELKELSSKFSKSAKPSLSSVLPSALPSVPADCVKSPFLEESSKLAKNSAAASQPPLQDTNRNQLATDTQRSTKSCLHRESSKAKGDPLKHLIEVVKSVSSKALNATIRDINAVTCLTDRVAGNFVRGKPTKVILYDLADDIVSCCDEGGMKSGMKRELDTLASDDFTTVTELYARGSIKRLKTETNNLLLEEIKEINKKLIEVVVDVSVFRPGSDEGTLIRCSYTPVGFSGNIKTPDTSKFMFPNLLLDLLVSADYPNSSPTVLEKMPSGSCDAEEGRYMWMKAKSNFILSLRKLSQPISVKDMAEAWDVCAREVFHELAGHVGGGSFCSSYGKWESCAIAV